jgi:hypothetical protein
MIWLEIGLGILGFLVLLTLVFWLLGKAIPEEHEATVTMPLRTRPDEVFTLIRDVSTHPSWAKGVTRVDKLPDDRRGHERWRTHMGRNSFVLETTVSDPPVLLTRTVEDDNKMFSGAWTYELLPTSGGGYTIRLTERGRIPGAIPRAMMKHLFGHHSTMKAHLKSLAQRLGQEAELTCS